MPALAGAATFRAMSTLAEIENAVESLPSAEKESLLRWLQSHLAARPAAPSPGKAVAWVRNARGSVRDAAGKSADELRMDYYAAKHGLKS